MDSYMDLYSESYYRVGTDIRAHSLPFYHGSWNAENCRLIKNTSKRMKYQVIQTN